MFRINGLTIKFQHNYIYHTDSQGHNTKTPVSTKAVIIDKDEQVVAEKVAICSSKDTFEKAKGRKIALSRALMASHFSKEERKEIWNRYLKKDE